MTALDQIYPDLRDAWIIGTSALPLAPEEWDEILETTSEEVEPDESERRLLALASQVLEVALRPQPTQPLGVLPNLPHLAKPPIPEHCRPWFRTVSAQNPIDQLLSLIDARGFTAHPLDWFPSAGTTGLPDTYLPWQDWLRGENAPTITTNLDEQSWAYASPSDRLFLLIKLRETNPDRARQLIADFSGSESAETRLKMVDILRTNLSSSDQPYLESLSADRSAKVRTLASSLLSRLGAGSPSEDLAELIDFLEVSTKGFITKKTLIKLKALKTGAQETRRRELFQQSTLADLAAGLNLTSGQIIDGWMFDNVPGQGDFVAMVASTASDVDLDTLASRLLAKSDLRLAMPLMGRASQETLRAAAVRILRETPSSSSLLTSLKPDLVSAREVMASSWFQALKKDLKEDRFPSLFPVAYVATAEAASALFDYLTGAGVRPSDPWLAPLRLNASLSPTTKE